MPPKSIKKIKMRCYNWGKCEIQCGYVHPSEPSPKKTIAACQGKWAQKVSCIKVHDDKEDQTKLNKQKDLDRRMRDSVVNDDWYKRCDYWGHCDHGEDCTFAHPKEPCEYRESSEHCREINHRTKQTCIFWHYDELAILEAQADHEIWLPYKRQLAALHPKIDRCRHWGSCPRGDECNFAHPSSICHFVLFERGGSRVINSISVGVATMLRQWPPKQYLLNVSRPSYHICHETDGTEGDY